jgi:hypothetical protein
MASISQVERETGLSKDTLRVWERRYGFPSPARNRNDERMYSDDQVQRLRVIRRLLDSGLRPGKIVGLPPEAAPPALKSAFRTRPNGQCNCLWPTAPKNCVIT